MPDSRAKTLPRGHRVTASPAPVSSPRHSSESCCSSDERLLDRFRIASPDEHLHQLWPHALEPMDPDVVYRHTNGGWKCNGCGALHGPTMYHCTTTGEYDLCPSCIRSGRGYLSSSLVDEEELPPLQSRGTPASHLEGSACAMCVLAACEICLVCWLHH